MQLTLTAENDLPAIGANDDTPHGRVNAEAINVGGGEKEAFVSKIEAVQFTRLGGPRSRSISMMMRMPKDD
ncbi:hypothetical protein HJC23_007450 [Cyclotella cryptica]|uniref:Uncharacterized protein n=1 Tax=Cyclotella cryptica TaxID=29204 RepID=A0ABD3QHU8_9STRA